MAIEKFLCRLPAIATRKLGGFAQCSRNDLLEVIEQQKELFATEKLDLLDFGRLLANVADP
jgi:hypothetical protein